MDPKIAEEIIEELASTFQKFETQSAALLEFVKEKGIAKDDELAPYMERAAAASAVRWRATRVRMAHLFASAEKRAEEAADRNKGAAQQKPQPEQPAPGDQHLQDDRSTKQGRSSITEKAATQSGSDHAKEPDERSVQKDPATQDDKQKSKEESASPPKGSHDEAATGERRSSARSSASSPSSSPQSSANQTTVKKTGKSADGREREKNEREENDTHKGDQNAA
jgi:hypothetical protein